MRKVFILGLFIGGNVAILFFAIVFLSFYTARFQKPIEAEEIPENIVSEAQTYLSYGPELGEINSISLSIEATDSRAKLVDEFYRKYNSPMTGLGKVIVDTSDKNGIPFGYIPAISGCESTFGKVLPVDSHNAWGYGIYGGKITRFPTWEAAIEKVASGLRKDYFSIGLDTPEKIMPKYTPPSKGSWADCVNQFLKELT